MNEERRKSENTALRELVDALRTVITARDGLWSLSVMDRLFRPEKYRQTIAAYDNALQGVRSAIQAVMSASRQQPPEHNLPMLKEADPRTGISLEEFEFLLGKPGRNKKAPEKKEPRKA